MKKLINSILDGFREEPFFASIILIMLSALFAFCLFVGSIIYYDQTIDESTLRVKVQDWGTVTSVSNCNSSKYSIECTVKTDKYTFSQLNMRSFPGDDMLYVGDKIFKEYHIYTNVKKTYYGRNGYITAISTCYSWMPCFEEKSDN